MVFVERWRQEDGSIPLPQRVATLLRSEHSFVSWAIPPFAYIPVRTADWVLTGGWTYGFTITLTDVPGEINCLNA